MPALAILPIKSFEEAKRRLRHHLGPGERHALAEAMFADVLIALRRSSAVQGIIVVSADHVAQQIAAGYGASVVEDLHRGHNPAASLGINAAVRTGAERALLVPGDCPALDPAELGRLIEHPAPPRSVLIVPDRHGTGTNALLLTPPDALAPSFGGRKDFNSGFQVAAYSPTAAWVAGVFALLPILSVLTILGLYSLYLLYLGLPMLMRAPPERAIGYIIAVIVCAVIVWVLIVSLPLMLLGTRMWM